MASFIPLKHFIVQDSITHTTELNTEFIKCEPSMIGVRGVHQTFSSLLKCKTKADLSLIQKIICKATTCHFNKNAKATFATQKSQAENLNWSCNSQGLEPTILMGKFATQITISAISKTQSGYCGDAQPGPPTGEKGLAILDTTSTVTVSFFQKQNAPPFAQGNKTLVWTSSVKHPCLENVSSDFVPRMTKSPLTYSICWWAPVGKLHCTLT